MAKTELCYQDPSNLCEQAFVVIILFPIILVQEAKAWDKRHMTKGFTSTHGNCSKKFVHRVSKDSWRSCQLSRLVSISVSAIHFDNLFIE